MCKVRESIVRVPRLAENLQVGLVILIKFDDSLDHRIIATEIVVINETGGIEITIDYRIAPINRQGVRRERIGNFFGYVARIRTIFVRNRKFISTQKGKFIIDAMSEIV